MDASDSLEQLLKDPKVWGCREQVEEQIQRVTRLCDALEALKSSEEGQYEVLRHLYLGRKSLRWLAERQGTDRGSITAAAAAARGFISGYLAKT